ncbi:hypothetical protein D3C72_1502670 [compost metagenome]
MRVAAKPMARPSATPTACPARPGQKPLAAITSTDSASSAICGAGTRGICAGRSCRMPAAGRSCTATSRACAAATGSSAQKAQRQWPACANSPPTAGPHSVATPHMPDTSATARGHSRGSNTRWISP